MKKIDLTSVDGFFISVFLICLLCALSIAMHFMMYKKYIAFLRVKEGNGSVKKFIEQTKKELRLELTIYMLFGIFFAFVFFIMFSFFSAVLTTISAFFILLQTVAFLVTGRCFWPKARHWAKLEH